MNVEMVLIVWIFLWRQMKTVSVLFRRYNISSIGFYIITQIILALWLIFAYDLLEDRRTIDVTITKFVPLYIKLAESFEHFYVTGPKIRAKKVLSRHWTGTRTRKKKKPFSIYSSSLSRQLRETKLSKKLVFKLILWLETISFSRI